MYTPTLHPLPGTTHSKQSKDAQHGSWKMYPFHACGEIFGIHFEPFTSNYHVHSSIRIFFDTFLTRKCFIMALMTHTLHLAHKLLRLWQFMSCSFTRTNLREPSPSPLLLLSGLGVQELVRLSGQAGWQSSSEQQNLTVNSMLLCRSTTLLALWPNQSMRRCLCGWSSALTRCWTPSSPGSSSSGSWTLLALKSLM